jgi:hypothetical protein
MTCVKIDVAELDLRLRVPGMDTRCKTGYNGIADVEDDELLSYRSSIVAGRSILRVGTRRDRFRVLSPRSHLSIARD